ncbi:hypothetical protein Tco_1552738 [Tanacetum coccineum]
MNDFQEVIDEWTFAARLINDHDYYYSRPSNLDIKFCILPRHLLWLPIWMLLRQYTLSHSIAEVEYNNVAEAEYSNVAEAIAETSWL